MLSLRGLPRVPPFPPLPVTRYPSPATRFSQFHTPIHRLEPQTTAALADRRAHAAGVHAARHRDWKVGGQAAVHGTHVEIGVEVRRYLDLDRSLDRRILEVSGSQLAH